MSALTETSSFDATVNKIETGEDITEALLNSAPQALANRTKYLNDTKAPINSPEFTGTPKMPTAPVGTNTTQGATTEFVERKNGTATPIAAAENASAGVSNKMAREDHVHPSNLSSSASDIKMNGTQAAGTSTKPARADHVHPTDTTRAPINSPVFTGTPTVPTAQPGTSTKQAASTEFVINNGVPAGTVIYYAKSTPPAGFLKANGAQVSRSAYAALFAVIGTLYGAGDGSTTFNVPDLRGEFIRGLDEWRGADPDYSRGIGSWQGQSNQAHNHAMFSSGAGSVWGIGPGQYVSETMTAGSTDSEYVLSTNGGYPTEGITATEGNEARPRNVALLACIKY